MLRKILAALSLCALAAGCTAGREGTAEAPTAPTPAAAQATPIVTQQQQQQMVTATVEEARVPSGGRGEAIVRLDIAEGFHVNANPPSDKFYIGTEVKASPQQGITPGEPVYPPAVVKKFGFSKKALAVYEGRPEIRLPLSADASVAKGRHTFRAQVRVQPCNDQECFPPRTIEAYIPVTVE